MTKELIPPAQDPKTVKPEKAMTIDEARRLISQVPHDSDPEAIMKKLSKIIHEHKDSDGANKDKYLDEMSKLYPQSVSAMSLETHARLGDVGGSKLGPLAIELSRKLIAEYECETTAETTMAEVAAAAYIRILRFSTALGNAYDLGTASHELNKFMSVMSVEVDRANRQYFTAINTLKTFKQPSVNVTFNAKTAFVAQHQNVNATPTNDSKEQTNETQ